MANDNNTNGNGNSNGGPSNAENRETPSLSAMDRLVQMQTAMDGAGGGTTGKTASSPKSSQDEDAEQSTRAESIATDKNLPAENAEDTKTENQEEVVQNNNGEETNQLPPELAALEEDVRQELLQMATDIAEGRANIGDIKRGHRLSVKLSERESELQDEIRTLREQAANGTKNAEPRSLPEAVSRLKNEGDVRNRQNQLEDVLDWCQDHPNGGEFGAGEAKQNFSAEDVQEMRRVARAELRLLPQRLDEIKALGNWSAAQADAKKKAFELFPQLKDANNAETKQVNTLLQAQPWISKQFVSPHIAALTWIRGQAAMRAEAAKRGPNGGKAAPGKILAKKPASGGTSAGGGPANKPTVKKAVERINQGDHSIGSLAELLDATGR